MTNLMLTALALGLLLASYIKDREKTRKSLRKSLKSVENILPQMLFIITMVGLLLAYLNPQVIAGLMGTEAGLPGVLLSAVVGAVTLIPGFIAFPTAAIMLDRGAGYMQLAAFISSLMMVGVVTLPLERVYFGHKAAFLRNLSAFLFSLAVAVLMGKVMGEWG